MTNNKQQTAVGQISFATIQRYLQNRNWQKIQSKREHLVIYYKDSPNPTEILLPLDRNFIDYNELIFNALQKISKNENRNIEQVINEMTNNKQISLIDALCIVKTGWRTEQEKELLDNAYLVIKQHSEILHLEYQRECINEKLTQIKGDDKQ
jgi:hypothetical protein